MGREGHGSYTYSRLLLSEHLQVVVYGGGSQTATLWTPGTKLTEFTGDYITEEKEPSGSGEARNNLSYRNREQDQGATQGQEQS